MSEATNRFDSELSGAVAGTAINTTFTVPAGCYFRGQICYYFISSGSAASCGVTKSAQIVAVLGPNGSPITGGLYTQNVPVFLNEGTYTVQTIQGAITSTVAWHGLCFRK